MELDMNCPKCKQGMQPIAIGSKIDSSEFYCHACHHSVKMPVPVAQEHIRLKMEQAHAAAGR